MNSLIWIQLYPSYTTFNWVDFLRNGFWILRNGFYVMAFGKADPLSDRSAAASAGDELHEVKAQLILRRSSLKRARQTLRMALNVPSSHTKHTLGEIHGRLMLDGEGRTRRSHTAGGFYRTRKARRSAWKRSQCAEGVSGAF